MLILLNTLISFTAALVLDGLVSPLVLRLHFFSTLLSSISYILLVTFLIRLMMQRKGRKRSLFVLGFVGSILILGSVEQFLRFFNLSLPPFSNLILQTITSGLLFLVTLFLWRLLPKLIHLPSPSEYRKTLEELDHGTQLQRALENQILQVTAELMETQKSLKIEKVERKQAQTTFEGKEHHFRSLIENALDMTAVLDKEGIIRYKSPSVEKVLGYSQQEFLGRSVFELIHPKDARKIESIFLKGVLVPGQSRLIEFRMKHADGSWRILEAAGKNLLNDPVVSGIIINARDITERRQAEKEIQLLPSLMQTIAQTDDFYSALEVAVIKTCETTGWPYGAAWVLKGDGKFLECGVSYSSSPQLDKFRKSSEDLRFLPGMDLPGQVWVSKKTTWFLDLLNSTPVNFTRSQFAKEAGIQAGLGVPIMAEDKILAVLVFFMLESRPEDKRLGHLVSSVAAQVGSVIQRKRVEGTLRKVQEELEKRIQERTEELAQMNEALQAEIMDRRIAEGTLRISQQNYQMFMNSIGGILWEYDVEKAQYSFVSEQAEKILGYPLTHWFSEPTFWEDHIHGRDREPALAFRQRVIQEKKDDRFEFRMITSTGRIVWLRDIVSVVIENDRVVKLRGMMVEITERKLMEEALHEERNFAAAVLDTASALVMVLDTEGRIVRFNRACERVSGYTIKDVQGKFFWDVFLITEEVERVKTVFSRLLAGQFPANFESFWVTKNENRLIVSWSNTVLMTKQGLPTHVIATGIDVTRRKEVENKLTQAVSELAKSNEDLDKYSKELKEANKRLQKMDEVKSHFISAASHELRTPLTSLKGYVEMILQDEVGPINAKQKEFLTYVKESTDRLHRLLNELLDISKIESGQIQMNLESTDVRALLKEEIMVFKPQADEKEISLSLETDPDLTSVYCDTDKMKEVMDNLIDNALKYTTRKGKVKIMARNFEQNVRIEVQDTGIGIRKEDLNRIFEPFQHIEKNGTESEESTGLGLTLVKRIVEAHGGKVNVKSQFSKGSTFIVDLPVGDRSQQNNPSSWVLSYE